MKRIIMLAAMAAIPGLAAAEVTSVTLQPGAPGRLIHQEAKPGIVCVAVEDAAGTGSPILLRTETTSYQHRPGHIAGVASDGFQRQLTGGTCLNLKGKETVTLHAAAVDQPVTVTVGPSRCAIDAGGAGCALWQE